MGNNLSIIKRNRQSLVKRDRNRAYKTEVKNLIKTVESAIENKKKEDALQAFKNLAKKIDSVTRKGIIHKNKSARKKSRLMKKINAL